MESPAPDKPKVILHWLEQSRSQRILWLLEELEVEYELKTYTRNKLSNLAGPELRAIHPLGKFPVIEVHHSSLGRPIVLSESGVIAEYLIENFGKHMLPQHYVNDEVKFGNETEEFRRVRFFPHYAEGSIMNVLLIAVMVTFLRTSRLFFLARPFAKAIASQLNAQYVRPSLGTHLEFLEEQKRTSGGEFLAGEKLTAADIMMVFPLEVLQARKDLDPKTFPHLSSYVKQLQGRSAYVKAAKRILDVTGKPSGVDI